MHNNLFAFIYFIFQYFYFLGVLRIIIFSYIPHTRVFSHPHPSIKSCPAQHSVTSGPAGPVVVPWECRPLVQACFNTAHPLPDCIGAVAMRQKLCICPLPHTKWFNDSKTCDFVIPLVVNIKYHSGLFFFSICSSLWSSWKCCSTSCVAFILRTLICWYCFFWYWYQFSFHFQIFPRMGHLWTLFPSFRENT